MPDIAVPADAETIEVITYKKRDNVTAGNQFRDRMNLFVNIVVSSQAGTNARRSSADQWDLEDQRLFEESCLL
jgi:hypothetical protein